MFKREKEKTMSLLQPVSDEFEPGQGQSVEPKHGQRPKSPSSKSSSSSRSVTPSTRPTSSLGKTTLKGAAIPTDRPNKFISNSNKRSNQPIVTPRPIKELPTNSTITPKKSSDAKARGRGISPLVRSTIPTTISGFSNETPPNLITTASTIPGRASSATRGRSGNPTLGSAESKLEHGKSRRQSCSPSVSRGRKVDIGSDSAQNSTVKGRTQAVNRTFIVGSRMVEKVMNARRGVSGDEKDPNLKHETQSREGAGYGRMMPRASLDMALKHMV
ncbi:putative endochitinase A [Cocos nucifera]|uniref:Putative endochitinase A n=1 Tax=Cocos nucifera TaxID=13894 RepID=A0A8K0IPC9_COCNU|nr:putative endochitinase A [Cocos nucifera]